ncbi:hypothetical protein [Alkalibacillus haloalkaliphilus]|uniref:hypothetical protein n=1 Tax=Alkalibacillus haloalkaliphilus TaxID=94136 RepID=UPI0029367CB3|nr:hypothetical protein [Alkalibacillus haloalkaliphilus]MDV2582802.1 hypothetical protein [Alkalibacillus haloalkaliphilus]
MKPIIIRPIATLLMGATYLISQFVDRDILPIIVSLFALITIISFIPYLKKVPMILISSLLGLSFIFFIQGEGLWGMFLGLNTNVSVLAIFIFVPLISIPIYQGNYLLYLETIFNYYIKTTKQLYIYVKSALMGVGSVMNLGTVPILFQLTDTESYKPYRMLRTRALGRGFAMAFMWSPYFISVALIISYFDVEWVQIFPLGIVMAVIGIVLGSFFESKHDAVISTGEEMESNISIDQAKKKLLELLVIIIVMTAAIMVIEYFVDLSVLTIIPLIAIFLSIGWGLVYQSPKELGRSFFNFTQERLPAMGNELSLFIAAGAFGAAILSAGASDWIIYFIDVFGISHILVLIPVLLIVVNLLSFVGVHPIITMTALAITLSSSPIFIDDHFLLSFGLLSAWMVSVISSPFSGLNLLMSGLAQSNPIAIGPKSNLPFALTLWGIAYVIMVGLYFVI